MADAVSGRSQITVNQTLHGYAQGHQQLAASLSLKPRDNKTLLVLSDISGPNISIGSDGYVTGYPLPELKAYVLAKTWAAPEMPRPGCVWTHSVIVDFSDLPRVTDPSALMDLFRRPDDRNVQGYTEKLRLPAVPTSNSTDIAPDFGKRLIAALYGHPLSQVIGIRPDGVEIDYAAIDIWTQQWPRLRRNFRFCTLAGNDRVVDGNSFDLQLFQSGDRAAKARVPKAVDLSDLNYVVQDWVEDAYSDLLRPDTLGLRSFMRRMGADIERGRDAFRVLCELHKLVGGTISSASDIRDAIVLVEEELPNNSARSIRDVIANRILTGGHLDASSVQFLARSGQIDQILDRETLWPEFGQALWHDEPGSVLEIAIQAEKDGRNGSAFFKLLSPDELISQAEKVPTLISIVAPKRPDLLTSSQFWEFVQTSNSVEVLSTIKNLWLQLDEERHTAVLNALASASNKQPQDHTIASLGRTQVLQALSRLWSADDTTMQRFDRILTTCLQNRNEVAAFLVADIAPSIDLLNEIASRLSPDDVPNELGEDPWVIAVRNSAKSFKKPNKRYHIWSFLMARALGHGSHSQAHLAQLSFETLYDGLGSDRYPDRSWYLLEQRLPWTISWLRWDRCERLIDAVSALFVDRNLSASIYANICDDDKLFKTLVRVSAKSYGGRQYLGYVAFELERAGSNYSSRLRAIQKAIENPYRVND